MIAAFAVGLVNWDSCDIRLPPQRPLRSGSSSAGRSPPGAGPHLLLPCPRRRGAAEMFPWVAGSHAAAADLPSHPAQELGRSSLLGRSAMFPPHRNSASSPAILTTGCPPPPFRCITIADVLVTRSLAESQSHRVTGMTRESPQRHHFIIATTKCSAVRTVPFSMQRAFYRGRGHR